MRTFGQAKQAFAYQVFFARLSLGIAEHRVRKTLLVDECFLFDNSVAAYSYDLNVMGFIQRVCRESIAERASLFGASCTRRVSQLSSQFLR
jgi:hypothetical protein